MGRTEECTDSTRAEMAALLEVLIGAKVTEDLVVMVDNQSILREISRWVGEGGRIGESGHLADGYWTSVNEN